jgi:hypothetical protein
MGELIKKSFLIICLVTLCAASPAYTASITVEAENYAGCYDYMFQPIEAVEAPYCVGGWMLVGFDAADEWVEYQFTVGARGYYELQLRCRGDSGANFLFEVTLTGQPSGDTQVTHISFRGIGYG